MSDHPTHGEALRSSRNWFERAMAAEASIERWRTLVADRDAEIARLRAERDGLLSALAHCQADRAALAAKPR